jgi:hypothetical protein
MTIMSSAYGYESRQDKAMIMNFWLTIGMRANGRPSVKATAKYPDNMSSNEITVNVKMKLPMALWQTPQLVANIEVAAPAQPVQIDAKALAEAVKQVVGMAVEITVGEPGNGE